jgi:hypothetical protein
VDAATAELSRAVRAFGRPYCAPRDTALALILRHFFIDCLAPFIVLVVGFGYCPAGEPTPAQIQGTPICLSNREAVSDCGAIGAARMAGEGPPLSSPESVARPAERLSPVSKTASYGTVTPQNRRQHLARDAAEIRGKTSVKASQAGSGQASRLAFLNASTIAGGKPDEPYAPYTGGQGMHFTGFESSGTVGNAFTQQTSGQQATVQVREFGKDKDPGLRSKLDGPAYLTSTSVAPNANVAFQSGVMKLGNQYLQYVYSGQKTSFGDFESSSEFIGDEFNRSALEYRIGRKIGNVTVSFMTMQNDHFESDQTGIGNKNAQRFNQVGVAWALQSWVFGTAMRDTTLYTGANQREIRAFAWRSFGPLSITQSLAMPLNDPVFRAAIATLSLYGKGGKMDYWGDVTFGNGTDLKLNSVDLGLNIYALGRWDLSLGGYYTAAASYGDFSMPSYSGVSLGLSTQVGGLRFGPVIGWDSSAGEYVLGKAWLPLGSLARPNRWYFPGQLANRDFLAPILGYDLSCMIGRVCR